LRNKPNVNVICFGNIFSQLKKKYKIQENYLLLYFHGKTSNVNIANEFEDFKSVLNGNLSSKTKDLLDIASAIYLADRLKEKDGRELRELNIVIPVREPSLWKNNKEDLKKLIQFLIRDNVNFYFEQRYGEENQTKSENTERFDSVVCFSGGLDSFVGTTQLIKSGKNPILISHNSGGKLPGIQKKALAALNRYFNRNVPLCKVRVSTSTQRKQRSKHRSKPNPSQFSRSFLFLSLATTLAYELEIPDIFMCENGILSINVPITEARVNTRTAHPKFLLMYQDFINKVFNTKIKISNPLLYRTKAEILKELDINKIDCINHTVSCWRYWSKKINHCGFCIPCIIRKISIQATYPFETEPKDAYSLDIFNDYPYDNMDEEVKIEAQMNVNDLIRFSTKFLSLDRREIQQKYPDLFIDIDNYDYEKIVDMHSRFAKEIINVFKKKGNDELKKFIDSMIK